MVKSLIDKIHTAAPNGMSAMGNDLNDEDGDIQIL
jgi:hypothetical protein